MASPPALRTLTLLPSVAIVSLALFALILGVGMVAPGQLTVLLGVLVGVTGLVILGQAKRVRWAAPLAMALAAVSLLSVAIFLLNVELLALYGLFLLVLTTAHVAWLGGIIQPLADLPLGESQRGAVTRVATTALARLGIVLVAALVLSALVWTLLRVLTLGTTSEFTAFLLATLLILILVLLATLPE